MNGVKWTQFSAFKIYALILFLRSFIQKICSKLAESAFIDKRLIQGAEKSQSFYCYFTIWNLVLFLTSRLHFLANPKNIGNKQGNLVLISCNRPYPDNTYPSTTAPVAIGWRCLKGTGFPTSISVNHLLLFLTNFLF